MISNLCEQFGRQISHVSKQKFIIDFCIVKIIVIQAEKRYDQALENFRSRLIRDKEFGTENSNMTFLDFHTRVVHVPMTCTSKLPLIERRIK